MVEEKTKREITPIVVASQKKEGLIKKTWRMAGPDDPKGLKDTIIHDVIIPGIKNALMEAAFAAIRGIFNSGQTSSYDRSPYKPSVYRPTHTPPPLASKYRDVTPKTYSPQNRTTGIVNELALIRFPGYNECVRVLQELQHDIDIYGWVSVADFKHMVSIDSTHADISVGWADTADAQIKSTNSGEWYIRFAEPYRE